MNLRVKMYLIESVKLNAIKNLNFFRVQSNSSKETREGPTYSSGIGLSLQSDAMDTEIPPPKPVPTDMPLEVSKEHSMVFYDLETTGLGKIINVVHRTSIGFLKSFQGNDFIILYMD